jgi:hypothetical protein
MIGLQNFFQFSLHITQRRGQEIANGMLPSRAHLYGGLGLCPQWPGPLGSTAQVRGQGDEVLLKPIVI